ncbi:hypothetical protein GQ54DRAFT_177587 [Martensiomyces pterosporus]|nr:hypothetical protein GQ54DRAFT_177587 [Martensiomyces pterosporus]
MAPCLEKERRCFSGVWAADIAMVAIVCTEYLQCGKGRGCGSIHLAGSTGKASCLCGSIFKLEQWTAAEEEKGRGGRERGWAGVDRSAAPLRCTNQISSPRCQQRRGCRGRDAAMGGPRLLYAPNTNHRSPCPRMRVKAEACALGFVVFGRGDCPRSDKTPSAPLELQPQWKHARVWTCMEPILLPAPQQPSKSARFAAPSLPNAAVVMWFASRSHATCGAKNTCLVLVDHP